MSKEMGGPSPEEMDIKQSPEIGFPESDMEYVPGSDGKPTDVIRMKEGKNFPPAPPDTKGTI